ncbi:sigma-70 family RNA polymerase sigma factor [Patescibacteria group bacterium]|nr:sigma-70 family RNA polymerase sigma factor [Patescibacteria group bacterium]
MQSDTKNMEQEKALFDRLKSDPEAITELYDRHAKQLYSFLLKRCGHKETAEDIVAQSFIKLLESAHKLEWKGVPISAWLYRVALNALADHWRSSAVKKVSALDEDTWDPPSDDDPAWNTEMTLEREKLGEMMGELSQRDQEVLTLRFYAGFKTEEVAKELDISNNHAAVLIYRALGRMRKMIVATN